MGLSRPVMGLLTFTFTSGSLETVGTHVIVHVCVQLDEIWMFFFNNPHQTFLHRRHFMLSSWRINFCYKWQLEFCRSADMTHYSWRQFSPGVSSLKTKVACTRVAHATWWNEATCQGNLMVKLTEVKYQSWLWSLAAFAVESVQVVWRELCADFMKDGNKYI
jgi:hypothetical protein